MIGGRVLEGPQVDPDGDLLGMTAYAERLAIFVQDVPPPFTLGVYGEWGDGKTTFVNYLRHYLQAGTPGEAVKFIVFSAWPHAGSDAVWRAMIIKIAQNLYDIAPDGPENAEKASVPAEPSGLWPLFKGFLGADALVLTRAAAVPDDRSEFDELIARLDRTAQGSISRSPDKQLQVNQEVALTTIVNGAITALGAVSPLVAQIRALFGKQSEIDLSALLQTEKNAATRQMIESMGDFKRVFRDLFEKKAKNARVFVFVDDLDRCLPDVALDVLEAIKIFFDESVRCTFIVAADENLIGQGLRLRYKGLTEGGDQQQAQAFFAQKGQEYFEKIIQFGVRVPPRTAAQTHGFIAAQFPAWTAASDIIEVAMGSNPRRLKQYCNLLSYKHAVSRMQRQGSGTKAQSVPAAQQLDVDLFEKITKLFSWSPECTRAIGEIATRADYPTLMSDLEAALLRSSEDKPLTAEAAACADAQVYGLYCRCVLTAPLFLLMRSEPLLAGVAHDTIRTLIKLADVAPDPETLFRGGDLVFSRILQTLTRDGSISVQQMLVEDLTRLIAIDQAYPGQFGLLAALAESDGWETQLAAIEQHLVRRADLASAPLSAQARDLVLGLAPDASDVASQETMRQELLGKPHLSSILPELVRGYAETQSRLPRAEDLLGAQFLPGASVPDRQRRVAKEAADMLPPDLAASIHAGLNIRLEVAQHFLALRKFAKLDSLSYKWPVLAEQFRRDGAGDLKALESAVIEPGSVNLSDSQQASLRDERLARFLRLRPLFREIYQDEANKYFAVSQAVVRPPGQSVAAAAEARPPASAVLAGEAATYDDFIVAIKQIDEDTHAVQIRLSLGNRETVAATVDIDPQEVDDILSTLQTQTSDYGAATRTLRSAPTRALDAISLYRLVGSKLFEVFFGSPELKGKPLEFLRPGSKKIRMVLQLQGGRFSTLPWESLYVEEQSTFLGLTQKFSIVRHVPDRSLMPPRTLVAPLRILVTSATPKDLPYLETGREIDTLRRALAEPISGGRVELEVLTSATLSDLQSALRRFQPHVFHFIGHGGYLPDKSGALLFEGQDGNAATVEAEHVRTLLTDSNISVAVLNACDTGTSRANEIVTGIAGALVSGGVPAVIATMRPVEDPAAIMFTREFYRSFVDGYAIEAALVEARKALSVEKWDWTSYALFVSSLDLQALRLVAPVRGNGEAAK